MGRNQHSKDRLFITATEWKVEYGGHKEQAAKQTRRLPFNCCALSLVPFETPMCTKEGVLFDILNIVPYVKEHKKNPLTGEDMTHKQLVRLNMAKNIEGKWHCPVTYKVFNDNSHVVAIKPTGNVFAYEAIKELNLKPKNFTDLLDGTPFKKKDIITLQDPSDEDQMAMRDLANFKHLQEVRSQAARKQTSAAAIRQSQTGASVLQELSVKRKQIEAEAAEKAEAEAAERAKKPKITTEDLEDGVKMTSGKVSGSFTSSSMNVATENVVRDATEEEIREARWKRIRRLGKKGYVQIQTTLGNLNVEVHCNFVPRVGENFLGLCLKGYYDGTLFHRLIRNFMVQGGDPTGTGKGGECLWGGAFKDEFDSRLTHNERGILSMANSGANTNKSQFFITFKSCRHLDSVHCVFGRVVGGLEVLRRIELVETDKKREDRPKTEVKILKTVVFVNPIEEAEKLFEQELKEKREAREKLKAEKGRQPSAAEVEEERKGWYSQPVPALPQTKKTGVGKYLGASAGTTLPRITSGEESKKPEHQGPEFMLLSSSGPPKKGPPAKTEFKDFSGW